MTAEREIAGFVLPFAAGTTAAFIIGQEYSRLSIHLSFICICASVLLLIHPCHKRYPPQISWIVLLAAAFSCGTFTGASQMLSSLSRTASDGCLISMAAWFGNRLKELTDAIPFHNPETSGMVKALLTGDRSSLTTETITAFRDSGAAHILALSGLHIGIIYGVLRLATAPLGNTRAAKWIKSLTIIPSCGFYVLATGASPSITRAFLFILIGELSSLAGRHRSLPCILMAALSVQLVLDASAIGNIGFQLSYAAIAGIAFIYPHLKRMWPEKDTGWYFKPLRKIWDMAALSISCQTTTGPLAWIYFGTFPKYFLLTNLIALPITGILIPASLLAIILQACGVESHLIIKATEQLAGMLTGALNVISTM